MQQGRSQPLLPLRPEQIERRSHAGMSPSRQPRSSGLRGRTAITVPPHPGTTTSRFFALRAQDHRRHGVPRSTSELEKAITPDIDPENASPKPFRWTKLTDDILASIKRFCNGPINRDHFDLCIETQLAPTLRCGDGIFLDNLASHKSRKATAMFKSVGAWFLFLPTFSPDRNPIEMAFAKLKTIRRKIDSLDRFLIFFIPQSRCPGLRPALASGRPRLRLLQGRRVRQFLQSRWILKRLSATRSNVVAAEFLARDLADAAG